MELPLQLYLAGARVCLGRKSVFCAHIVRYLSHLYCTLFETDGIAILTLPALCYMIIV
jgi:hypothetical protein